MNAPQVGTVVIGAGQAGLAVGYHLARHGRDFVLLDAGAAVGDSWRARWDSLQLFTPAGFTHLPGLPFPAPARTYPRKDDVAEYLAAYADRFDLPVHLQSEVDSLRRDRDHLLVTAGPHQWRADNVVLTTGAHRRPVIPALAGDLHAEIMQLHSRDYRRAAQLPSGRVLVVGAGNSGAEIALDLATDPARKHEVLLAGRDVGHTPQFGPATYPVMQRLGRPGAVLAARALRGGGDPLGRVRPGQLQAAGVQRLPKVVGTRDSLPLLHSDHSVAVGAIIWCTGLRPDYSWLHLDVLDATGHLRHRGGIVREQPGLYAVGLPYQRSITSHLLGGVGADARHIVNHLLRRRTAAGARRITPCHSG